MPAIFESLCTDSTLRDLTRRGRVVPCSGALAPYTWISGVMYEEIVHESLGAHIPRN